MTIRYNLLNLPELIQFKNGSQIVNKYDAAGTKLESRFITCIVIASVPVGNVSTFQASGLNRIYRENRTYYCGNYEYSFDGTMRTPVLSKIHNSEGYKDGRDIKNDVLHYYRRDHLGNVREVWKSGVSGVVSSPFLTVQRMQYYPSGLPWADCTGADYQNRKYNGKEFIEMHGYDSYDYHARHMFPALMRFTTPDPLAEKYYSISPYAYCANNPVMLVDPDGMETRVVQNEDGTYRIIGGVLNKDRNIYVYTQDKNGNYTIRGNSIGITTSTTSFYNADANGGKGAWAIGSIINPNDKSGDNFLGNIFGNTPTMIDDYMANAGNGGKYDFKVTNETDEPIPGIDTYRGMPIGETRNGQTVFSSARDIGNIAAGYVAGANGMSWEASRIAFDIYQSKVNRRPSIESISTRNAEYYGWRIGSNIRNNTSVQKANNLLRSIWRWITK